MEKSIFTLFITIIIAIGLTACDSSSSSDNASLDGEITIEATAPAGSGFFLTVELWDGEEADFAFETITVPESGVFTYDVEGGPFVGVGAILGPIGDVDGVRLAILSDGNVLAETTTPDSDGAYTVEVGTIPDFDF